MTRESRLGVALGALALAFLVVRAKADQPTAPAQPVGTTSMGPLSYPEGTRPHTTPEAPRVELPPYPTGGFTRDMDDPAGFSWEQAQERYGGATISPRLMI